MKVEKLPVFAKFVFICENPNFCVSTTDINVLQGIKFTGTAESIYGFRVGTQIYFDEHKEKNYEVTEIEVNQITDDLVIHKYGSDSDDCTPSGVIKEFLFKVTVWMKLLPK